METVGFLYASRPPCQGIRDDEVRRIKRTLVPVGPGGFPSRPLPKSWVLAVLVCPGDSLQDVAAWVRGVPRRDRERVYVYFHPATDRVAALSAWYAAGLDDPIVSLAHDFTTFHKSFGARMNLQTYNDFR